MVETTSSLCVLLEINMSNNPNVSISIEVQLEEILPENAFSVFLETCYQKDGPRAELSSLSYYDY